MDLLAVVARPAADLGGTTLRIATGAIAAVRPTAKPLHPRGSVVTARLARHGGPEPSGSPWLDDRGEDVVTVRRSRAVGLPAPAPDIFGLALRVPTGDETYGDVLFATTGLGRLTRFTLTACRSASGRPMTTLLPYRSPTGPVLLAAVHRDPGIIELAWARPRRSWNVFAELTLPQGTDHGPDARVSFDPVRNPLPGLDSYDWVRRLREPSYRTARLSRRGAVA